jgi:CBS domain-containing protein
MVAHGTHRVAVVDNADDAQVCGVITQSAVLRIVHDNMAALGRLGATHVGELFPPAAPFVLHVSATTRQCIATLVEHGFTGCPLVDDSGAIVANVSVADVRDLAGVPVAEAEANLDKSALWFVSHQRPSGTPRAPITVLPTDTLATLIELFAASRVHRVYTVRPAAGTSGVPVGVITLTDVLRVLLSPAVVAVAEAPARPVVPAASALTDLLRGMSAEQFLDRGYGGGRLASGEITAVPEDLPVTAVLEVLTRENISAVPVYKQQLEYFNADDMGGMFVPVGVPLATTGRKYVGWVDSGDISALILERGLVHHKHGVLAALSSLVFGESSHESSVAINFSNNDPFWVMHGNKAMEKVRVCCHRCRLLLIRTRAHASLSFARSFTSWTATSCTDWPSRSPRRR